MPSPTVIQHVLLKLNVMFCVEIKTFSINLVPSYVTFIVKRLWNVFTERSFQAFPSNNTLPGKPNVINTNWKKGIQCMFGSGQDGHDWYESIIIYWGDKPSFPPEDMSACLFICQHLCALFQISIITLLEMAHGLCSVLWHFMNG